VRCSSQRNSLEDDASRAPAEPAHVYKNAIQFGSSWPGRNKIEVTSWVPYFIVRSWGNQLAANTQGGGSDLKRASSGQGISCNTFNRSDRNRISALTKYLFNSINLGSIQKLITRAISKNAVHIGYRHFRVSYSEFHRFDQT